MPKYGVERSSANHFSPIGCSPGVDLEAFHTPRQSIQVLSRLRVTTPSCTEQLPLIPTTSVRKRAPHHGKFLPHSTVNLLLPPNSHRHVLRPGSAINHLRRLANEKPPSQQP